MLRLFLEGKELELTEDVQVAITKQFEELSNPTTIINDWSKTVSIPFTHNNDAIFGYFFRPDKLTTYMPSSNYLTTAPTSIKKWNGSAYVDDSLSSGNIVCDINAQYVQVGFQYQGWKYSNVKNFSCNNDWHSFEFNYIPEEDYRFEFSFRDMSSDAPNNEVYYVQWDLYDRSLVENETYVVSFKHKKSGNNYIIYDYSLSKKQSLTGINFDPLQKLDFRLEWNGATLMTGYAKLNEIKQKDGNGTYNITLFGQLGKIFQEMKKITFDTTTNDTQYLIHGEKYVDETINKELIGNCWATTSQSQSKLYQKWYTPPGTSTPVIHPAYKVTDIIGFAPNNSFSEGFKYDTYQVSSNSSNTFENSLGDSFKNDTGIDGGTVIPNGMLPREIGEYRSYLQLPYIYFNKLFQIFQEKAEEITGYKFSLDNSWFNTANPYWYNLVYMLKGFSPKNGNVFNNSYKENGSTVASSFTYVADGNSNYSPRIIGDSWHDGGYINLNVVNEALPSLQGNAIYITKGSSIKFTTIPVDFSFTNSRDTVSGTHYAHYRLNNGHYPSFEISLYDENDNLISGSTKVLGLTYSGREVPASDLTTLGIDEIVYTPASVYCGWQQTYTYSLNLPYNKTFTFNSSASYKLRIRYKWNNISNTNHIPFASYEEGGEAAWNRAAYCAPLVLKLNTSTGIPIEITKGTLRSDVNFTINDLWNNDFNVFDQIVKYCKMFRICITVNNREKTINFEPFQKYFKDYSIIDWTGKVDKSKDFTITPVSFENKYILFNYNDSKTKLGTEYKEKYGVNYGEYRLRTEYNFNTETVKLFDKITPSITNTDNVLSWSNLHDYHRILYSFPAEIYVYDKDKDNKQQDIFGAYYFHNGIKTFDTESALHLRSVSISDDTVYQRNNNTYFYTRQADTTLATATYPYLDIVRGDNICLFNKPSENYTYANNYNTKNCIYKNLWETYLSERYNRQNKKVTCYVRMKPSEYMNFKWGNFIKIDDTIYVVNKIYDYDVTSNQSVKVDLITVQNIDGYTDDSFLRDIDTLTLHFLPTSYLSGIVMSQPSQLGTFESATNVTFANGDTTYTTNNVRFTISGNNVYYQTLAKYVDKEDADFNVTLKNEHGSGSFHCVRYAVYPYPEIKLYESDGETERSTIYPGTRNYKLGWYGTETYGLENKPTVTIEIHGTGPATIDASTWDERDVVIAEGDDEWFRTEYVVNFNTSMTNYSGSYVRVTIVDKEGWHDTRDFPVSL